MKRSLFSMFAVVVMVISFATVVYADYPIDIGYSNINTISAAGGSAYAEQYQGQYQVQYQSQVVMSPELLSILKQISQISDELAKCYKFSYGNLLLREELVIQYKAAFECNGNIDYLYLAIKNASLAEQNFQKGFDINQNQSKANQTMRQVYRFWAFCIWKTTDEASAQKFANSKQLKAW